GWRTALTAPDRREISRPLAWGSRSSSPARGTQRVTGWLGGRRGQERAAARTASVLGDDSGGRASALPDRLRRGQRRATGTAGPRPAVGTGPPATAVRGSSIPRASTS